MNEMSYEEMKRKLIEATDSYYNNSFSLMSDEEFDELKDSFEREYPDDPFLKTIGAPVPENTKWEKKEHKIPMLSCNKVKTLEEFNKWIDSVEFDDIDLVISEKLDGISLSLDYIDGNLVAATTRGDGFLGENILPNVIKMKNVKTELPISFTGSLRGEIILKNDDLKAINFVCKERKERTFQNVRNGASGIAKRFDGRYSEYLTVLYYYCNGTEQYYNTDVSNMKMMYEFIEDTLELETCKHYFGNVETARLVFNEYDMEIRAGLNHAIDGLIVQSMDNKLLDSLGKKGSNWKGQIAWKFTSEQSKTRVKDVVWQLGTGGRITPVLIMEPVEIMGVTVSRATVHNLEIFNKFNFHKNDVVIVKRSGDVIPYICNNLSNHPGCQRGEKIEVVEVCPVCGDRTYEDGVYLVCNNEECKGRKIGDLIKWIRALDLKDIAEATLEKLYDAGYVKSVVDLYRLKPELICELDGFKTRSANKIVDTLNSKKELKFSEFIAGLNIPNFSAKTAELLEKNGYDLKSLTNVNVKELENIKGIGSITANEISWGIYNKRNLISDLLDVGISIKEKKTKEVDGMGNEFTGKKVVFTGAIQATDENGDRYTRKRLQQMVLESGGECPSSLAKDTDFLVVADPNSNSAKLQKARKYGTDVISEKQFFQIIGG